VSCFIYYYAECHHAECRYAECRVLFIIMLNVIMLSVAMLSVVMLSVISPFYVCACARFKKLKIKRFLNLKWLGFEAWKEQPLATLIFNFKICSNFLKVDLSVFFVTNQNLMEHHSIFLFWDPLNTSKRILSMDLWLINSLPEWHWA